MKMIHVDFQGKEMTFRKDGWFNATVAAKKYGKRPVDWLRLPDTVAYLLAVIRRRDNCEKISQFNQINELDTSQSTKKANLLEIAKSTGLVTTRSGSLEIGGGTWLHPKLAVLFARWLDVDFAVWCDEQIDELLRRGQHQAMSVWQELHMLNIEDGNSFMRASFGSRLMLERKKQLPDYRKRRARLEKEIAPQLFQLTA